MPSSDDILKSAEDSAADELLARTRHRSRRTVANLRAEIRELNATVDDLEETVATLEALRKKPAKARILEPRSKSRTGKLPVSFVALASDWHTCELVRLSQTNGINEHNMEIGHERAWAWARGVVAMLKREQETCDVETFVLWLGGDALVNASMRYKAELSVHQSPHEEARIIRDLLASIIAFFRAELDVPRMIVPTSWGNHDRSTEKMLTGHGGEFSFIQQVYYDLAGWFAADPTLEFQIAESEWEVCDIYGFRILFHHGHYIGYGAGQAGLGHPLQKAMAAKSRDLDFDTLCVGHFHQRGIYHSGRAFTNGSLVGANGYSMDSKFPSERPSQVAFVIDHQRQEISNYYAIWAD